MEQDIRRYDREARRSRLLDYWLRTVTAVLAVASPALVALQSELFNLPADLSRYQLQLTVIAIVALGGAGVTLQSIFEFGRRSANARNTATRLFELKFNTEQELDTLEFFTKLDQYAKLRVRLDDLAASYTEIVKQHAQEDIRVSPPSSS